MKIQQKNFHMDFKDNLSNSFRIDEATIVDIAKFNCTSIDRKQRRDFQSLAARELLDSSLQKHFPQSIDGAWSLNKSETGKPFLSGKDAPSISISHSGTWCACAISKASFVGIDIEVIKHRDWESYSKYAFHPEEAQWILAASDRERDIRGLICWCRKEAVVKALGLSLSDSLSEIGFSSEGVLIEFPEKFGEPLDWKFLIEIISDDVVVAVAWKN
jgi:4'-phosphopantetheinyl transferase